ncbi:hypothetical protein HF521_001816 [Silurus meridionalis]|uniref:Uncharacterized protein n=1 Tax=Silurus meridionalis TaxID=175797 RepID=A0A8T0B822_SILME|nr:hypothetical protein HF521_001816 [Silurus meridionalis]
MSVNCPSLSIFSTDELIQKVTEAGIQINEEEERRFRGKCCVGEDSTSVEAHVNVLQTEYKKKHPDILNVKDRMARTFSWRRR